MSLICRRPSQKGAARLLVVFLSLTAVVAGVPSAALANHGARIVDVEVEAGSGTAGSPNNVVVKLSAVATAPVDIKAEITGPNDPDDPAGFTPESADVTCQVAADSDSCSLAFTPALPGLNAPSTVDTFTVWIADAGANTPDTGEGADESRNPGLVEEPDQTDVVFRVTNPQVSTTPVKIVDCKNPSAETTVDKTDSSLKPNSGASSKETYTCNVKSQAGNANLAQQTVDIENLGGPNDVANETGTTPDYSCGPTDANGNCSVTIPAEDLTNGQTGTAFLCFWADDNADDVTGATLTADGGACPERWDADAGAQDIPQTDVLKITWEVPVPTTLNIDPENVATKNPTTDTAVFPMTLKDQFDNPIASGDVDFKVLTGPNRKVTATADLECTTAADGTCSITLVPNSFQFNGIDKVCAWIDSDNEDDYVPAGGAEDGGGCAAENASPETDDGGLTDRGQVTWAGGNPAPTRLEMEPETQSGTASTTKTVNVKLTDEQLDPLAGFNIDFEITGVGDNASADDSPDAPDATCTTGADGRCTTPVSILGSAVGDTLVRAWVDVDNDNNGTADGEIDATEGADAGDDQEPAGAPNTPGLVEESDTTDVVILRWTASPTSVTMGYSAPTILWGTQITLAGFLKDGAGLPLVGKTVVVERRLGGQSVFGTLATSVTDVNGRWTWTGRPGSTADYRASFLGEAPGYRSSKSSIIKVSVRVIFSELAASTRTPAPGVAVAFTGKVLPVHSGRRVYLQVLGPNNSWRNVATTLCNGTGFFRMTYRRNVGGTLNFRILYPAQDLDHGGNISSRFSIRWG